MVKVTESNYVKVAMKYNHCEGWFAGHFQASTQLRPTNLRPARLGNMLETMLIVRICPDFIQ